MVHLDDPLGWVWGDSSQPRCSDKMARKLYAEEAATRQVYGRPIPNGQPCQTVGVHLKTLWPALREWFEGTTRWPARTDETPDHSKGSGDG